MQLRCLAADVLADRVDLVGRDVQLVAALVGDEQVVAFDAADRALDHALVLADAVLVVHDVVAGLEVLERGRRLAALAVARLAVGAAAAGEVGLGDDRDLGVRQGAAAVERCDDDRSARPGASSGCRARARSRGPGRAAATSRRAPSRRRRRRRRRGSRRRGGSARRSVESGAVADRPGPSPSPRRAGCRVIRGSSRSTRTSRRRRRAGRRVRRAVEGTSCRGRGPRSTPAFGEVVFFGDEVGGAVAHPARLDQHDLGLVGQDVGDQGGAVGRRRATAATTPCRRSGALPASRSHCSRPHGSVSTSAGSALADVVGGRQLAGGEDAAPRRGRRSSAGR